MADDSRTFQEFLIEQRKTNEQLASLRKENVLMGQILADIRTDTQQDSTTQAYIKSALPEILSDTKNTNRQIKLDKEQRKEEVKEGLFEIDDILKDLRDVNLLGFDALLDVMEKSAEFDRVQAFREKREQLASGEHSPAHRARCRSLRSRSCFPCPRAGGALNPYPRKTMGCRWWRLGATPSDGALAWPPASNKNRCANRLGTWRCD